VLACGVSFECEDADRSARLVHSSFWRVTNALVPSLGRRAGKGRLKPFACSWRPVPVFTKQAASSSQNSPKANTLSGYFAGRASWTKWSHFNVAPPLLLPRFISAVSGQSSSRALRALTTVAGSRPFYFCNIFLNFCAKPSLLFASWPRQGIARASFCLFTTILLC